MAYLQLSNIEKYFGDHHAIKGVDLQIEKGEFVVFVGPSGCGKSTLLRMIAGLEVIDKGSLQLDKRDITALPSSKRDLAMVFQSYALYPHMTVFENMSFALKLAGVDRAVIREKVDKAAAIPTWPNTLSARRRNCRAVSASASPSAAPSCAIRRCSCSMNRCRTSTPRCACRPASRSPSCTATWAPRRSTSPTTRSRR